MADTKRPARCAPVQPADSRYNAPDDAAIYAEERRSYRHGRGLDDDMLATTREQMAVEFRAIEFDADVSDHHKAMVRARLAGYNLAVEERARARVAGIDPAQLAPLPEPEEASGAVVCLADVQPERVRWLWSGRIPLRKLTILDGDPGLGKSALTLDIAARVSRGAAMPDGSRSDLDAPASVVLLSAEDGLADTIRPRLDAMDADVTRVFALESVPTPDGDRLPTIPDDLDALREVIEKEHAALVVIDPVVAYLGSGTNSYRDQDVRRALAPLAAMAEATGAAVVVVRHLNKGSASNPLYRGGGSIGIIGAARSGLLVARDPDDDDRRILALTKSNISAPVPALAYRLNQALNGALYLTWEGATDHTAAQLLNVPVDDEERTARGDAKQFLREILADGPMAAKDVQRAARDAGISEITLRRARVDLGVEINRQGFGSGGAWTWALPPYMITKPIDDHPEKVIIYGESRSSMDAGASKESQPQRLFDAQEHATDRVTEPTCRQCGTLLRLPETIAAGICTTCQREAEP